MDLIRQLAGIAITLVLMAASLWLLKRRGNARWRSARTVRALEVIESRGLAPGHTLHLVRIADRVLAIATHTSGCTLLEARPWSELEKLLTPEVRA